MNVTINQIDNKFDVVLQGRLDTTNADQFLKDIDPLMKAAASEISIDCTDMEYTSSQGLRMFLMLQKNANAQGSNLVLKNMRPQVKEVFDITGFSNIIKIV